MTRRGANRRSLTRRGTARRLAVVVAAALTLGACGSSSTKTVTKVVPPSASTSSTSSTMPVPPTSSTTTTVTTQSSATIALPVLFQGAVNHGSERPNTLELTGDGTLYVGHVQWNSWGGDTATGTGTASYHGCNPNCASAPVSTAAVSIRLSNIRICSGRRYYAALTLTLPSGKLLDESYVQRSWSPC